MIRLAVAGAAHGHVRYALDEADRRAGIELVALSEPHRDDRERWTPPGVPSYADHAEMLQAHTPDVVAACGVYGERADVVVEALHAGAHVIADKPLCTELEDLGRIAAAAATTGRHVSLMLEKRWYPGTLAARRLVEDGVLGTLALISSTGPHQLRRRTRPPWFFRRDSYGDLLGDLPVHDVDLVLALTGATGGTVTGVAPRRPFADAPEFCDSGALVMTAGEVTATIEAHWLWPDASTVTAPYRMRLTGTEGVADIDWWTGEVSVRTDTPDAWRPSTPAGLRPAEQALTALAAGTAPEVATAESLAASRVALLAARSAHSGSRPLNWSLPAETPSAPRLP